MTFTAERIIRILITILVVVVLSFLVYSYSIIVLYAIIAVILSYIIEPLVNRLQSRGMSRVPAILLSMNVVLLLLVWIFTSVFPTIISQLISLAQQLNINTIQNVASKVEAQLIEWIPILPLGFFKESIVSILTRLFELEGISDTVNQLLNVFTNVFYAVIIIPFSTFFFLKDGSRFRRAALEYIPNDYFEISLTILSKIEYRLISYFKSVGLQSLFVGIVSWILLASFGFKNALAIAVVTGLANTIPYFGPLIGYTLAVLVAIFETGDFDLVGYGLLAILITQLLDNIIFQPVLFSKSADLHPILILFGVLIGAETAGVIGMLIAIPIATILKILYREISNSINRYHVFQSK